MLRQYVPQEKGGARVKYERWNLSPLGQENVDALIDAGYPYLVASVLASRGVATPEQAAVALERERKLTY